MRTIALDDATPATSGGKASTLATLRYAGFHVPDGFVIPVSEYRRHYDDIDPDNVPRQVDPGLVEAIDEALRRLLGSSGGHVAVRSSATDEDGHRSSAAGQHDTILAVRGTHAVADAVARCWGSLCSSRATTYRLPNRRTADPPPAMAVLVQRLIDADVSGVLFTQTPRIIEATPGLGALLVSGQVTPDAWTLDDTGILARRPGDIARRLDRRGENLTMTMHSRAEMCLEDAAVHELDRLGQAISTTLGYEADVEWAIAEHRFHTLQARPITATLTQVLGQEQGVPASPGLATGTTCVLRGPGDFHRLQRNQIIVCRTTDPAWTPLFRHAAGIITEIGGVLSHAAIVARELGIPALLSVPHATTRFPDGTNITIDGTTGHIHV